MKQILVIECSPKLNQSNSRRVGADLLDKLKQKYPEARVVYRDVAREQFPHVDGKTAQAFFTKPEERSEEQEKLLALSDQAVDEFLASEIVLITAPMWNFSVPSSLKAWIDHIVRPGRTFVYTAEGPKGLAAGRKIYVIASSGGKYSEGPLQGWDHFVPYFKTVFGFMGIQDVNVIRLEKTNTPALAEEAIKRATHEVELLVI